MKSNYSKFLPFLILLTILLVCCSTPKELEYRDFKNFTVEDLGFTSSAIKMDLVYYNPNNFGLKLKQVDLDIFVNNNFLGHTTTVYEVNIPKRAEFSIPVKMDVDMKNLLNNGLTSFFSRKEVLVKANGMIRAGKANLFFNIPVNYEGIKSFDLF